MVVSLKSGQITEDGGGTSNDPVTEVYNAIKLSLLSSQMLR